jgi:hypothetical protein
MGAEGHSANERLSRASTRAIESFTLGERKESFLSARLCSQVNLSAVFEEGYPVVTLLAVAVNSDAHLKGSPIFCSLFLDRDQAQHLNGHATKDAMPIFG